MTILRPRWGCYCQNVFTSLWILFRSNVVSSAKTKKNSIWQPPTYMVRKPWQYGVTFWYTTSIRHGEKSDINIAPFARQNACTGLTGPSLTGSLTGRGFTGCARSAPRVLRHQSKKRPIYVEFLSRSRFLLKQFMKLWQFVHPTCSIY